MLVDKQSELMSDLLFTVHQHGGDDVTWNHPYTLRVSHKSETVLYKKFCANNFTRYNNEMQNSYIYNYKKYWARNSTRGESLYKNYKV